MTNPQTIEALREQQEQLMQLLKKSTDLNRRIIDKGYATRGDEADFNSIYREIEHFKFVNKVNKLWKN